MFDTALIDTDRFMDLPMSAKAIYFLLGMEADDEGFVSYKKVLRIHGGTEDDVKVLTAKGFLIAFPSGVVVITDWNENNYIDKNRARPTLYQPEKAHLLLNGRKYVLNNGLTRIGEDRIGEESILSAKAEKSYTIEEEPTKTRKPADQTARSIMQEQERKIGRRFANPVVQMAAIRRMLDAGYTKQQILDEYVWASKDSYWSSKGVDFKVISSIIHKEHD